MSRWIKADEDRAAIILPAVRYAAAVDRIVQERAGLSAERYRMGRMARLVWYAYVGVERCCMDRVFTDFDAEWVPPAYAADMIVREVQAGLVGS